MIDERIYADTFHWLGENKIPGYGKRVDAIITDPPYNLAGYEINYLQEQFTKRCDGTIVVFSPPENPWLQPCDQYLFWVKPTSTKNVSKRYSRFVEMIFIYQGNKSIWNHDRHWSQYTNICLDIVDDAKIHPFRKPPSLIERLVLNHTNEGDTVLDPFAGSFVVADVCKRFNRNCISIEKDLELYEQFGIID